MSDVGSYQPPVGQRGSGTYESPDGPLSVETHADWIVLREHERPVAEMFYVAYLASEPAGSASGRPRPVTFVFNGGPGAASAYLHLGALGPDRVQFSEQGEPLPPPVRLEPNAESWFAFTDLVFVDPVGTGFSRALDEIDPSPALTDPTKEPPKGKLEPKQRFYGVEKDLASLGEFISRWLSGHHRWSAPVFIVGESYGGYRVARLARSLQEDFGVGLNGAVLVSPALELSLLDTSDYDDLSWVDVLPSMAATAAWHRRSEHTDQPWQSVLDHAERFAAFRLAPWLALGDALPLDERATILSEATALLGVPESEIQLRAGRLAARDFCRLLLRDQRLVLGLYDAALTTLDPFPDRAQFEGPDPTLFAIERVFASGINHHLRTRLGVETDRDYRLLSFDVNRAWKIDKQRHAFATQFGATDDLRYAMSLNPHMEVMVAHGIYDLVTPYAASKRLLGLMKLTESQRARVHRLDYPGGHMFYNWTESRRQFRDHARELYGRTRRD
jgi:carboxypeptidase C (cathepsin A)